MTLRAPDPKYAIPRDTDQYQGLLAEASAKDSPKNHGRWWMLEEFDDRSKATSLQRKMTALYREVGFGFKVVAASDKSSVAVLVRFDPPTVKENHADE